MQLPTLLELLLKDEKHPRALAYQLNQLQKHIAELPREGRSGILQEDQRLILKTYTDIQLADSAQLSRIGEDDGIYKELDELLENTAANLWKLSDIISQTYFSHVQSSNLQISTPIEEDV